MHVSTARHLWHERSSGISFVFVPDRPAARPADSAMRIPSGAGGCREGCRGSMLW